MYAFLLKRLSVLLLLPLSATAQQFYRFEQLPADIGLAQGAVNCIKQDSQGILWLGTWSGLVRYDGYQVRIFQ